MTTKYANAYPRKQFFLEMFTRDISLEDCILDLIDNSMDALIRTDNIDISGSILHDVNGGVPHRSKKLPEIAVSYSNEALQITDTCGGISRKHALEEVFNFGHSAGTVGGQLGAYGIGLKRAIFKIGNQFSMKSQTPHEGFSISLNIKDWSQEDEDLDDWRIPLVYISGTGSPDRAGTTISIKDLRPEVRMRLDDGSLETRLPLVIAQTYSLFLGRYVTLKLNKSLVEPFQIPLAGSEEVQIAHDEFEDGDVKVILFASLAARGPRKEWRYENAGWYVACNGRIVVAADKTDLTGWGSGALPSFHSKYRGFVGLAFFQSQNPLDLPWTTTKRGLNRESPIYQKARNRMRGLARPIMTFLDKMYPSDAAEEPEEREIADRVKPSDIRKAAAKPLATFNVVTASRLKPKTTLRIQYDAEANDVERIKKHLRRPSMKPNEIGKHTFDYFLKTECPK